MKKTYVKPTAECEEFVANEFVAACWKIVCDKGGTDYLQRDKIPTFDLYDADNDGFGATLFARKFYSGSLHGKEGDSWILIDPENGEFGKVHIISDYKDVTNTDDPHPNASV